MKKKTSKAKGRAGQKQKQPKPARGATVRKPARPAVPTAPKAPARAASTRPVGGMTRMPHVRPLRDRVLVRRIEATEERAGGIIVPDTAKEKPQQAEVVAVGSGRVLESGEKVPLTLKAGDKVLVGKWAGTDVKLDGEEYLILKEDEILGILG